MVDIDPNLPMHVVRFHTKDKRKNKRDDKFEITRQVAGIRDTNNYQDLVRESLRTAASDYKVNNNLIKDDRTIVDLNLYDIPQVHLKLTDEQAASLRRDPNVWFVERAKIRRAAAQAVPWGITRIKSAPTQVDKTKYHRGLGVKVAIADSGFDFNHVDLAPNYKGGMTSVAGTTTPMDDFNPEYHGTHVAGTVGAADNNDGVVGVAPEAWLYAVKVLDSKGVGLNTDVAEGYVWCNSNGMQVVNSSFGGAGFDQGESDAVHAGYLNNVFWGCAANNNGRNEVLYPAAYPNVWCVGSVGQTDTISTFSNWGPVGFVDFVGPGENIQSDMPNNKLQVLNGTSMATPHICGLATLAFANYRFSPCDTNTFAPTQPKIVQIVGAMISSCDTLGKTSPGVQSADGKYGFGMPQANTILKLMAGV